MQPGLGVGQVRRENASGPRAWIAARRDDGALEGIARQAGPRGARRESRPRSVPAPVGSVSAVPCALPLGKAPGVRVVQQPARRAAPANTAQPSPQARARRADRPRAVEPDSSSLRKNASACTSTARQRSSVDSGHQFVRIHRTRTRARWRLHRAPAARSASARDGTRALRQASGTSSASGETSSCVRREAGATRRASFVRAATCAHAVADQAAPPSNHAALLGTARAPRPSGRRQAGSRQPTRVPPSAAATDECGIAPPGCAMRVKPSGSTMSSTSRLPSSTEFRGRGHFPERQERLGVRRAPQPGRARSTTAALLHRRSRRVKPCAPKRA